MIGTNGEVIATDPSINNNAVYDADGNLIGYEDPYGNVYDASGKLVGRRNSNGELIGTNGEVIEAYPSEQGEIVHGPDGKIIGRADAKGNVYDANGKLIGRLNERGELIDDKGNVIGSTRSWFDPSDIMSSIGSIPGVRGKEISETLKTGKYGRSLGIALTPDGEYLGEIMEDDSVVDEDGNIVGYRTPDGLILDEDGEIIGTEDYADDESDDSSSPFIPAGSFGPGGAYGIGSGSGGNLGPGGGYGPGERYDPVRQAALNAAMQERRSNMSVGRISSEIDTKYFDGYQKDWADQGINKSISSWRVDMSEMIFSDKPIPAVIARAIDTNNPAPITAYVERNVYAEEGRNIIIPAGSRLIGAFGSITAAAEATSESARVQITWERLIRPDGSIFVFSGQTADAQGRAGALGYVDQQLFKKYTLPVVTTVLTSAASYFIASAEDSAGEIENSKQQAASDARENFLTDMESLFDDILADKTDVKAMTYIPAGTRIIIYPNSDLWLNSHDRSEEAANSVKLQKPKVFIDDEKELNKIAANESNQMAASTGGSVVYNPDEANVEEAKSVPLIAETPPAKKGGTIAPPPPPPSGGTMAPPPPPSSSDRGSNVSDSSIPALF